MTTPLFRTVLPGLLLAVTLSVGCSQSSEVEPHTFPPNLVESSTLLETVPPEALPTTLHQQVRETLSEDKAIPLEQISVLRHSREIWSDSCLGLGGPAESCLLSLVEGWQIEVVDTSNNDRYYYRTDLTGDSIRLSTTDLNLPPSIRDLILQLTAHNHNISFETLSVIEAEPQDWDGCMGLARPEDMCTMIALLGWRATVSDGSQSWVYHTDALGNDIRLNTNSHN